MSALEGFLHGNDEIDLDDLRAEILTQKERGLEMQAGVLRLTNAWAGLAELLRSLNDRAETIGPELVEAYHADPFVRGQMFGEGSAWLRVRALLQHLFNAMSMLEVGDE